MHKYAFFFKKIECYRQSKISFCPLDLFLHHHCFQLEWLAQKPVPIPTTTQISAVGCMSSSFCHPFWPVANPSPGPIPWKSWMRNTLLWAENSFLGHCGYPLALIRSFRQSFCVRTVGQGREVKVGTFRHGLAQLPCGTAHWNRGLWAGPGSRKITHTSLQCFEDKKEVFCMKAVQGHKR